MQRLSCQEGLVLNGFFFLLYVWRMESRSEFSRGVFGEKAYTLVGAVEKSPAAGIVAAHLMILNPVED